MLSRSIPSYGMPDKASLPNSRRRYRRRHATPTVVHLVSCDAPDRQCFGLAAAALVNLGKRLINRPDPLDDVVRRMKSQG